MVISMSDFGSVLGTRFLGRAAYSSIMEGTRNLSERAVFDFSGVTTVTNSFADEVFGRMALNIGIDAMRDRTSFRNIDPLWARIVRHAIDERSSQREAALA